MTEKAIIFDASTLITFSMNGLLNELRKLKKIFNGRFIITKEVKYEVIDRPIESKRFELEALQINQLLEEKILEMPSCLGINEKEISKKAQELLNISNSTFFNAEKSIHIIDLGEASCLALGKILSDKKIENVLGVDERTTRILCEKPENLKELLKKKLHTNITYKKENLKYFSGFKIIRSCELIYLSYKRGLTELKGKQALDAFLYAFRFKGCSISDEEISEMKRLG